MDTILVYLAKNKEWIFSGIGLFALTVIGKFPLTISRWWGEIRNKDVPTLAEQPILDAPENIKTPGHIIEFILNTPLDQNVTHEELSILKLFSKFPRSQHTQAYRLDWIFEELLNDTPASTAHLFLENLLAKGYLEKWTTRRGNHYYRISDNGRRYLVDHQMVPLNGG